MLAKEFRLKTILVLGLALLVLACRGNLDVPPARTAIPTATLTPTLPPTSTPPSIRVDCDAIRDSEEFVHLSEQDWFIANCLEGPITRIAYKERLGIGPRVMEIFSIDTEICDTGYASFTVLHEPDLEMFFYAFRHFCADINPLQLAFSAPPFSCADSTAVEAVQVELPWLPGFVTERAELFCSALATPGPLVEEVSPEAGLSVTPSPSD